MGHSMHKCRNDVGIKASGAGSGNMVFFLGGGPRPVVDTCRPWEARQAGQPAPHGSAGESTGKKGVDPDLRGTSVFFGGGGEGWRGVGW
jgi:hypothetical protein